MEADSTCASVTGLVCAIIREASRHYAFHRPVTNAEMLCHLTEVTRAYLEEARTMTSCGCLNLTCSCPLLPLIEAYLRSQQDLWVCRFQAVMIQIPVFAYDRRTLPPAADQLLLHTTARYIDERLDRLIEQLANLVSEK